MYRWPSLAHGQRLVVMEMQSVASAIKYLAVIGDRHEVCPYSYQSGDPDLNTILVYLSGSLWFTFVLFVEPILCFQAFPVECRRWESTSFTAFSVARHWVATVQLVRNGSHVFFAHYGPRNMELQLSILFLLASSSLFCSDMFWDGFQMGQCSTCRRASRSSISPTKEQNVTTPGRPNQAST